MKVLIVGLGIIGGSYAKGLSEAGYKVYGVDLNEETIDYAKKNKFIIEGYLDPKNIIPKMDLIVLCLYPEQVIPFITKHHYLFNAKQVITDACGVKNAICYDATKLSLPAMFVGSHPMAGKEQIGIKYADNNIFKNANFLICPIEETKKEAIDVVTQLANALNFGNIHYITPFHHDKMIAYTSQLTHAIAVSLVNADTSNDAVDFIGDSFRDLTRIARINEKLWSDLFFINKECLLEQISDFEKQLDIIKKALISNDKELLKNCFKESKKKRELM